MDLFTTPPAASASALGVSSRDESNSPPGKIRSACNRCHSQKLRCVKNIGQVSCQRCLKLKSSCRFGPRAPRASLKPREQATNCAQSDWHEPLSAPAFIPTLNISSNLMIADVCDSDWHFPPNAETGIAEEQATIHPELCCFIQGDSTNMQDMHWPGIYCESKNINPLDHGGSTNIDLTPINENIMSHASSLPSPGISDSYIRIDDYDTNDGLGTSPTSAIRRLASLAVALYKCATKLPPRAKAGVGSASIASNGMRNSRKPAILAIDELFRLTTDFIDVMKYLSLVECDTSATLPSTNLKQPGTQSALPIAYSQQLSHAGQPVARTGMGPQSSSFSHVDEATMFMVVSCHCRLTEIYVSIFQMMQACIEHSLVPQMGKDWAIILPQLQIGSVTSPPVQVDVNTPLLSATTSSMYMLMITMLSSQLWEQLANVIRVGGDIPTSSAPVSQSALADMMWEAVTDRTNRLSQTIDATKHLLRRYSVVAE